MAGQLDWKSTKQILLEVETLFNREDDCREVEDIKKMQREIEVNCSNNLKDAKEIIKQLTCAVAAKEAEVLAPTELVHAGHLERFLVDKENVSSQLEAMRAAIDAKRESIAKLATTTLAVKEKAAEVDVSCIDGSSRVAYALALYTTISNITWDYQAPAGRIAGHVGNDKTKEINSFNIDARTTSSTQVADALWAKIGEGLA